MFTSEQLNKINATTGCPNCGNKIYKVDRPIYGNSIFCKNAGCGLSKQYWIILNENVEIGKELNV